MLSAHQSESSAVSVSISTSPSLRDTLRHNDVETMFANARFTAAANESAERSEEARRQIHQAMYRFGLGQITEEERRQILVLLEPCCPGIFFRFPIADDPQPPTRDVNGGAIAAFRPLLDTP